MKALVYNGPRDVSVSDVPEPRITKPGDAVIEITRTNICSSDLHMHGLAEFLLVPWADFNCLPLPEDATEKQNDHARARRRLRLRMRRLPGPRPARPRAPEPGQGVQPVPSRPHPRGKASPSFVVSHQLPLAHAPDGYRHFDARDSGWTKVILSPAA